jgi:threonine synthase
MSMKYFSTNRKSVHIDFKEATIKGLAPDKGLYFPEYIPPADKKIIRDIENYSNAEIAYNVI